MLPLSDNLEMGKDMHAPPRALGMSENSDAVVVVVSEETGIISLAKNGVLIRRLGQADAVQPAGGRCGAPRRGGEKAALLELLEEET